MLEAMVHYICDEGDGCDPQVPSCPACDAHPMLPLGPVWACHCGERLAPLLGDPVWPEDVSG